MLSMQESLAVVSTALMLGIAIMALLQLGIGHREPPSNAWLIVTVLAVAAMGAGDLASQLGLLGPYRVLKPFSDTALLVIGPALWMYLRQAGTNSAAPRRRRISTVLHLTPAALLFLLLVYEASVESPAPRALHRSSAELVTLMPIAALLIAYAAACAIRVVDIRRRTKAWYSDLDDRDLSWLVVMTLLYVAGLLVWMLTWRWTVAASNALTGVFVSAATAWIGIRGSRQRVAVAPEPLVSAETTPTPAPEPYSKARLPDAVADGLSARLAAAMTDDKAYLESDLTLGELAERTGVTSHQLSQYLSVHEQQSFYDFVNRWRVDAVKATLMRPGSLRRPLLEVALECGFGSKSAFNSIFKKVTGMSPSEYRAGLPGTAAKSAAQESMS